MIICSFSGYSIEPESSIYYRYIHPKEEAEMEKKNNKKKTVLWLCTTAMLMALNVAMSSFGVPVPGGHLYMNDIVICTAAILLDPLGAFLVGGA